MEFAGPRMNAGERRSMSALGAITPIGGIAFIAAWVCLAWKIVRR